MIVNYNGYKLYTEDWVTANSEIDANNPQNAQLIKTLDYDENKFNKLIREHKYEEAANYASRFRFDDVQKQIDHENDIQNLRRDGRRLSGFYSQIADEDMDAIDFNMGVFEDRGLDILENNEYANKFNEAKNQLGGKDSTTLKVIFQPTKRYLFGIERGFFDALLKDNPKNIENFYDSIGMTQQELDDVGIKITNEKGRPTLTFDKSHALANKILYNLAQFNANSRDTEWWYKDMDFQNDIQIEGYDGQGKLIKESPNQDMPLRTMKELINITQNTTNAYKNLDENKVKVYSSTIGGLISPELEELKGQYQRKEITASQYRSALNTQFGNILSTLKSIGSGAYQMYGNNGKDINDNTLRMLSSEEREEVIRMINAYDDITLQSMVSNGKIGTLVTIGSLPEDKKNIGDNPNYEEMTKSRRFQVFIPGLFTELAQKQINRNTLTRAAQEINMMQDWDSTYKTVDNTEIKPTGLGTFYKIKGNKKEKISKDEAQREINKDMAILDGRNIKYQFINAHDELINYTGYDDLVKLYAYNIVNELYPNVPLEDVYGNPITIEKAFEDVSFLGTRVKDYSNGEISNVVDNKLKEFYRIYNSIMSSADYYIRNNKVSY